MKSLSGNIKVASGAKKATKPSMSFLAKASLASAFRCLISSCREVAEVCGEECIHPICIGGEFNENGCHYLGWEIF